MTTRSDVRRFWPINMDDLKRTLREQHGTDWPPYQVPNGGHRILNSIYTTLTSHWVNKYGEALPPMAMSGGHLQNSLNLLKESHGNVVARSTSLLGRMRYHYRNMPDICETLDHLCKEMQKVEVDQMYPVFNALSRTLVNREELPPRVQDTLDLWDDNPEQMNFVWPSGRHVRY